MFPYFTIYLLLIGYLDQYLNYNFFKIPRDRDLFTKIDLQFLLLLILFILFFPQQIHSIHQFEHFLIIIVLIPFSGKVKINISYKKSLV